MKERRKNNYSFINWSITCSIWIFGHAFTNEKIRRGCF